MFALVGYASSSVVDTIGTFSLRMASICGRTFFSDELVHSTTTSGLAALIALLRVVGYLDAKRAIEAGHFAEVATDLRGIDVDCADDLEAFAFCHLLDDADADGPEPEVKDSDGP